jgi:fumarate hydratase subunit beta
MHHKLTVPIPDEDIRALKVGDTVSLNGTIMTGRDAAHKYMIEHFIRNVAATAPEDEELYAELRRLLDGGVIYHCGPVVRKHDDGSYSFVAAGPTTSIREEVYQPEVIEHFNLKGVIGKGGMGPNTLRACQEQPAVYLHAIGGAASLIAESVKEVEAVHKLEFGVPEAMWVIRVEDFPLVVTMDSHGQSIHETVQQASKEKLAALLGA